MNRLHGRKCGVPAARRRRAIARVIIQLAPIIRDESGRRLYPKSVAALVAGIGVLYLTSLLVTA